MTQVSLFKRVSKNLIFNKPRFDLRVDFDTYYLRIAADVAERSTCIRRKYGAVIVSKDNRIISTGYNGAPIREPNCCDKMQCVREAQGVEHGTRYELCVAVHAEQNAIIKANRMELLDSTIYIFGFDKDLHVYGEPCLMCKRVIINAGIARIKYFTEDEDNNLIMQTILL